ncbi:MAG TPA: cbb3-type cytochrome c oxidase subunit I [Acidimicrobiales bacterium]|nr:cbb3-type cytochrome c oxidase subunit I [Acidimicrobiales bacterium]
MTDVLEAPTRPAAPEPPYTLSRSERRFIGWHLGVAIAALTVGSLFGPFQAFNIAGGDIYPHLDPVIKSYYQGLTLHGVLNALVFTTIFITGFITLTTVYGLRRPLARPWVNQLGFTVILVGLLMAAVPLLLDEATVLYTFYPPLEASWAFYLGLTLVVVGSWIEGYGFYFTLRAWRREHPGVTTPFVSLAGIITMVLWQIATLGVAVEILTMLLPWSFGWTEGTDPALARTYFWFTGHPLVYFWLLPAYISWYGMLPRQAGGKLFSETLARLAFWSFLVLSIPVGFHHQFADPGIPAGWKLVHSLLTYGVFLPSLLTAFTVIASLEYAARRRGGRGRLGWMRALPWGDPSVAAQLCAGLLFLFGGIGGLENASYNLNLVVHNTMWIPGHLHLTVATATALSFMGITYWLVPHLMGKGLVGRGMAQAQVWTWFGGMILFSNGMHQLGVDGAPRRTPLANAPYVQDDWASARFRVGLGGAILLVSLILYVVTMLRTALGPKVAAEAVPDVPIAESLHGGGRTPWWLDSFKPWLIATVVLIVVAYGAQLVSMISDMHLHAG